MQRFICDILLQERIASASPGHLVMSKSFCLHEKWFRLNTPYGQQLSSEHQPAALTHLLAHGRSVTGHCEQTVTAMKTSEWD